MPIHQFNVASCQSWTMHGHLFIINGDLTKIACDAILIPTDDELTIEPIWAAIEDQHEDELAELRRDGIKTWGSKKVLRLARMKKKPWVWLGNIGQFGDDSGFEVFESTLEEFVKKSARAIKIDDRRNRIQNWPVPRVAVNVLGSEKGGGAHRKGDLVRGLVQTLTALAHNYGVDIVLVTFGVKPYAAAQRARLQLVGDSDRALKATWRFTYQRKDNLIRCGRSLAANAINSRLVLFIGAGVSSGAGLPRWNDLICDAAKNAKMKPQARKYLRDKDLRDQATIVKAHLRDGEKSLNELVVERLKSRHYALLHGLLASLPTSEAVTTNFDDLFESAWITDGMSPAILPQQSVKNNGRWLLKLHGTVTEPEKMVLTRSDYLNMPRQHGALMGLVQGLLMMRHMMFVGYSLRDEDFHELIHEVRDARGDGTAPLGTVLTLHEDKLEDELWGNDLHVVPMAGSRKVGADATETAARQLEMFIDLVAYLSSTSAAFFLDKTYDELLSDKERRLRDTLTDLMTGIGKAGPGEVAFKVSQFLRNELGAEVAASVS